MHTLDKFLLFTVIICNSIQKGYTWNPHRFCLKDFQKILADELYNVFLKFIQVSRGGRGFTSLVFGMGQLSEEGIAKKIAEQISVIAFKAPRLLHMEKEFTLLREAALRAYRQEYPNREHFLNKY